MKFGVHKGGNLLIAVIIYSNGQEISSVIENLTAVSTRIFVNRRYLEQATCSPYTHTLSFGIPF